ncbi:MAG: hypothetical protein M3436_13180 [Pseudomonadota bacterium]|nr:hypothetical protein [Pseudomonadota bacterium]
MKLYRLDFQEAAEGTMVSWHGSKRAAEKHARLLAREFEISDPVYGVSFVEIRATRAGLIEWLNVHLDRDTG